MTTQKPAVDTATPKRAVIYLRVSTAKQANKDIDPEGYSLPAQREACLRKAETLGAEVVEEYIDRGESAKTVNRPQFQAMVARVTTLRDVDYVILHKVDRFARNRRDDANTLFELHLAGAELVSVSENIDDTPSGALLHGIMATFAEYESRKNGAEALKGMTQKAKRGGTPGKAPIGYLNVTERVDGRDIKTVAIDQERGPLIRHAFEMYATGEWSIRAVLDELTLQGLRTVGTRKYAPKPLELSHISKLLQDRYYLGIVTFQGIEHEGRHEPLVSPELFERVQQVLRAHASGGNRQRRHDHYLKGTVFCARCGSRLTLQRTNGRGGQYLYFFCAGRQRGTGCVQRYVQTHELEESVVNYWAVVNLSAEQAERARQEVGTEFGRRQQAAGRRIKRLDKQIVGFRHERSKLLEAHYHDAIPVELLKTEQDRISREMTRAEAARAEAERDATNLSEVYEQALELAENCQDAYRSAPDTVRRQFNQVFWTKLFVDDGKIVTGVLAEPFTELYLDGLRKGYARNAANPDLLLVGQGSNKNALAPPAGLEPAA